MWRENSQVLWKLATMEAQVSRKSRTEVFPRNLCKSPKMAHELPREEFTSICGSQARGLRAGDRRSRTATAWRTFIRARHREQNRQEVLSNTWRDVTLYRAPVSFAPTRSNQSRFSRFERCRDCLLTGRPRHLDIQIPIHENSGTREPQPVFFNFW